MYQKALCCLLLALLCGCNREKESAVGGPGAAQIGNTFKLIVPGGDVDLKHNEQQEVTISIERGPDFAQDVKLRFNTPPGIKVGVTDPIIKAGQSEKLILLEADETVAAGEVTIEVVAEPESGTPVSMEMKADVKAP